MMFGVKKMSQSESGSTILDGIFRGQEEAKYQIARTFYQKGDDLPFKTDLSPVEIKGIIQAEFKETIVKEEFGIELKTRTRFTEPIKEHNVSKNRMGRAEMVEIMREPSYDERGTMSSGAGSRSRFRRIMGV